MTRLLLNRLLQAILIMLLMSLLITTLIGLMPGDPVDLMIASDPSLSAADVERLRRLHGVDVPILERWWHWLTDAMHGKLGYSRLYAKSVPDVLWPALASTLTLLGLSLALSLLIALPLGVLAALKPYSLRDYAINFTAFAGISLPSFWLALMLIIAFAVQLRWLPAGGIGDGGTGDYLRHLVLPVLTLTLSSVGGHVRFVRGAMRETLRQDFIRTARAKGAGVWRVVCKHALRNALLPVVTVLALECGALFSGALIVETVFSMPGMGKLIYDAVMGNDYNLALVALLLATFVTLCGNLLADLAYGWLDPRIRLR